MNADRNLDVAVVVPTRDEAGNVVELFRRLAAVADDAGLALEVIVVDDSDDDTAQRARDHAWMIEPKGTVEVLARTGAERQGGLGSAVVRGLRAVTAPFAVVMDGDLQHPPEIVPELVAAAKAEDADVVVASRYAVGGDVGAGFHPFRMGVSRHSTSFAKRVLPTACGAVTDPLSGFFLIRRDTVVLDRLRPRGFKILMEILARHPQGRICEVPFSFGMRTAGQSKANVHEGVTYMRNIASLYRDRDTRRHHYDVHGLVTVSSDGRLPELEAFRVGWIGAPDIDVRVGLEGQVSEGSFRYREVFRGLGFAVEIERRERIDVRVSRLLPKSPHVLYTNVVEPVLRWTLVERDVALVHAACVSRDGEAILITARTDTGKTTTMLKLLDADPTWKFLADDLVLVDAEGTLRPYPKPLTISAHTVHALPRAALTRPERMRLGYQSRIHSRLGRRVGFALDIPGIPVATANALLQIAVPPPKYAVQRLVPTVEIGESAQVGGLVIIARGGDSEVDLEPAEALETLLANCEDAYGFPPYPALAAFLLDGEQGRLREREREIIASALAGAPAAQLESSTLDWAKRIPGLLDRWVRGALVIDLRGGALADLRGEEASLPA
ncbi:MAG TPA: glycosyltransferase [Acidimicrobiales bacterium]|nr:glycosyltransferase [Acidimicrobiales bacterium]